MGQNKSSLSFWTTANSYFFRQIGYISATLIIAGCGDCFQQAEGIVLDKNTKMPIDSVTIVSTNTPDNVKIFSTKTGQFKFNKTSGGITDCPDLTLYFYKKGFKQNRSTFKSNSVNDTIYLEKEIVTVTPARQ